MKILEVVVFAIGIIAIDIYIDKQDKGTIKKMDILGLMICLIMLIEYVISNQ